MRPARLAKGQGGIIVKHATCLFICSKELQNAVKHVNSGGTLIQLTADVQNVIQPVTDALEGQILIVLPAQQITTSSLNRLNAF